MHAEVFDVTVVGRSVEAEAVVSLVLEGDAGVPLPAWEPGAHIDLEVEPGVVRQYSLCGDSLDTGRWTIAVKRHLDGAGGSDAVHRRIDVGSRVSVSGPRNHFRLETARSYLFIAGGIGITPIRPMVDAVARSGAEWRLVYTGRDRRAMAFAEELERRHPDRVQIAPTTELGRLDVAAMLREPVEGELVYCCGPEELLDDVERHMTGWPPGSLRSERFTPKTLKGSPDEDVAFEVELALTGTTIVVPPGRTILECANEAGAFAPSSCGEGTCGTCETRILEGQADHRDSLLSPDEQDRNETMMICVSRSRSPRLVLDL
jgi:ferredoxin-NADP reductase